MGNSDTMRRMLERISAGDVDGFCDGLATISSSTRPAPGWSQPRPAPGSSSLRSWRSHPDLRFDPEDIIEDGDKLAVRVRITGTNKNDFMDIPASGKCIDIQGIDIVRVGDYGACTLTFGCHGHDVPYATDRRDPLRAASRIGHRWPVAEKCRSNREGIVPRDLFATDIAFAPGWSTF